MTTNLANQPPTAASAESAVGGTLPNARRLFGLTPRLKVNLSRFQTFVGFAAGTISIIGAVLAVSNHFFTPALGKGDLVAVVVDAKTESAVSNATVEILTLNNAVVTTVSSGFFGKAASTLAEGQYRLRVGCQCRQAPRRQLESRRRVQHHREQRMLRFFTPIPEHRVAA